MKQGLFGVVFGFLFSTVVFAGDPPKGFEDAAALEQMLAGKVFITTLKDTATEQHTVIRSFFKKVSPEAYVGLATDHVQYPRLFPQDIRAAKTLKVNDAKTEFDYMLRIVTKIGPLEKKFDATLHQVVTPAPDAISETKVFQSVTNYKDMILSSAHSTRLIPWEDGLLVEDDIQYLIDKSATTGGALKKKLNAVFNSYTTIFRKELKGTP